MKRLLWCTLGIIFCFNAQSLAQIYPSTLRVPVTYYDFHSDTSCPDFQTPNTDGVSKNMVARILGPNRKPQVSTGSTAVRYFSEYLKYWYCYWDTIGGARGDKTHPIYNNNGSLLRIDNVAWDTSYKNIRYNDSLTFNYVGGTGGNPIGTYEYVNDNFFPLDGRGFLAEGRAHNFAFTMELHWEFVKVPGLTFRFTGDDDVWAFINDTLRMDIGGIHVASRDSIIVDNLPNLVNNQKYKFDFFYAERHTDESHIRITTNIISAQPSDLRLTAEPTGDICAGTPVTLSATVVDDTGGVRPEIGVNTSWTIFRRATGQPNISPATGSTVYFTPTEAYDSVFIEGRVTSGSITLRDTVKLYIKACTPHHLVIENSPNPTGAALRDDTPLDTLRIPSTDTAGTAYAVLRDIYGNFVSASPSTGWSITQGAGTILNRVVSGNTTQGQGIIYKAGSDGVGVVQARSLDPSYTDPRFTDQLPVRVASVNYSSLGIFTWQNGVLRQITSLTIQARTDTILIVQGYRPDFSRWEYVPGKWDMTNLTSSNSPPPGNQSWTFKPQDTSSNGRISVLYLTRTTNIPVNVTPGGPGVLKLFSTLTGETTKYPDPNDTVGNRPAGTSIPIFARVYDLNDIQLTQYNVTNAPITWSIREISGAPPTGTLQGPGGNQNALLPTRAYNVVQIIATFNDGNKIFSDTVSFRIIPGPAHHLTTQNDTATIFGWADVPALSFGPRDTSRLLYPIIRDVYENYIARAELATWSSRNSSIATAQATTRIFLGEGKVVRIADSTKETWVDVYSSTTPALHDSVRIQVSSITYDSLQIYILNGGMRIVDTIKVRTDTNQIVYARGKRSDGRGWDDIAVKWNIVPGLDVTGTPPGLSQNWNVIPRSQDTGKIYITNSGSVSDTIVAIFTSGLPNSVAIYKSLGNPSLPTVQPYVVPPYSDTLTAGTTYPFIAKIFDRNMVWLSRYENNTATEPFFSWQITRISGETSVDTLDKKTGSFITFSPKKAYITYQITATFQENGRLLTTSVNVYVKPGPVDHLVIEGSPTPTGRARNYDAPLNGLSFGAKDTFQTAFAILRDANQNFVSPSQSTGWQSLNELLFTVAEGTAVLGEGRVHRVGETGQTDIIAWNKINTALRDTLRVRATDFSYDSLKIVVKDSIRITELIIPSTDDTLLQVLGLRSFDKKWVPVLADWTYTSTSGNQTHQGAQDWLFAPGDTTSKGKISVTLGDAVPYSVNVMVVPGPANSLSLYPKRGAVTASNVAYPNPTTKITAVAGKNFPLAAKIFDLKNVWLSDYESSPKNGSITWSKIEMVGYDSTGVFKSTGSSIAQGDSVSFFPIKAYQQVYIVAKLSENGREFIDTVLLDVVAGEPKNLFVEGSSNWQSSPNKPNPADTIRILGNMANTPVYAILRDSLGNFARYSTKTTWDVVNKDTAVSVWNGVTAIGEGIISRNDTSGFAKVFAVDSSGLRDTVAIILRAYYYLKLRIAVKITPVVTPDSLTMPTTADTTLFVQGLRSDTTRWEFVDDAVWEISPNLKVTPVAPVGRQWRFSPSDTGTGFIRVTQNNRVIPANDSLPDTLWVHFIPGPPSEIRVKILTPPAQRIAGEQIQLLVELFNEDGKVKGPWDFNSAKYTDLLPDGGRPKPFVLIGSDTLFLGNTGKEQFIDGVDTVPLVLYYAPWNKDSLHQVTVTLDGLKAVTERFELVSGGLHHLKLERQEQFVSPVGDTLLVRTTDDLLQLVSIGYDIYGNRRGKENSNWDTDSTLHKITGTSQNTPQIVYYLSGVKDNEFGNIIAAATKNTTITTKVFIKLMGPAIKLKSSTTDDVDGDGYLDRLVLKFDRPVTIPKGTDPSFIIKYGSTYFDYDSIGMNASRTDSIIVIYLKETIGDSAAQTGWKPVINFDGNIELGLDSILNHTSIDGAGPVITRVTDKIVSSTDRKLDVVTVTLSEPIQRYDNVPLKATDIPSLLFYVWEKDQQGKMILKDSILAGIDNITFVNDTTITFVMTNGYVLSQWNYFSIKTAKTPNGDTTSLITDKALLNGLLNPNYPNGNNVQVKVLIIGDPDHELKIYPNPASADDRHTPAGSFVLRHDPQAYDYLTKTGGGGIIFSITFLVPDKSENVKVRLRLKVYDAVGNPVISGEESDITAKNSNNDNLNLNKGITKLEIYWNLFKQDKIKLAPGMYKVIEYLEYYGSPNASQYHNSRNGVLFGVHQRPPKNMR